MLSTASPAFQQAVVTSVQSGATPIAAISLRPSRPPPPPPPPPPPRITPEFTGPYSRGIDASKTAAIHHQQEVKQIHMQQQQRLMQEHQIQTQQRALSAAGASATGPTMPVPSLDFNAVNASAKPPSLDFGAVNASAKPRIDPSERSAEYDFSQSGALLLKGLDNLRIRVKEDDRSLDGSFGMMSGGGFGWSKSKYVRARNEHGDAPLPWNLDDERDIWHKLVFLNRLGQGASGVVERKIDAVSLELVAVKQVALHDAEAVKSIAAELSILNSNQADQGGHQLQGSIRNLVALYGYYFDRSSNQLCLVMEYCEGGSLQDLIDTGDRLSQETLVTIARDALAGMWFIHSHGKIHRDVKPGNLLIDRIGRVKVADFGLARQVSSLQQAETFVGTTTYMSPERLKGDPYGFAADV